MHASRFMVRTMLAIASASWLAPPAMAQTRPTLPGLDVLTAPQLSPQQISRICEYGSFWTTRLAAKDATPEAVEEARAELIRPLNAPQVANDFRFQYSKCVVPELQPVIRDGHPHAAVNAILVVSHLGSDRAANLLLDHGDLLTEPRWQIRARAAAGCRLLLQSGSLPANKIVDAARRLRDATGRETDNLVLQRQFEAIDAADVAGMEPGDREQARKALLEAFQSVVDRIAKNNNPHPNPLLGAVSRAVLLLRDSKFLNNAVPIAERDALGKTVAPNLVRIIALVGSRWEEGHGDAELDKLGRETIGACEGFLRIIDERVRGKGRAPQSSLQQSWAGNQRDAFESDLRTWQDVTSQPPYNGGR